MLFCILYKLRWSRKNLGICVFCSSFKESALADLMGNFRWIKSDFFVSRIFFIKGEGKAVLINHGEYFSVYSGLKEVFVKTGEKVLTKEDIGVVLTSKQDKKTQLHFEIWKGYDKENPSKWLYKAN